MTSTASPTRSEFSEDMYPTEPLVDAKIRPTTLKIKQPSVRRRATRSLILFCTGVAATLAWQSYGDATREMIASSYPQLGWLAPETVGVETTPEITSPIAPATTSDSQEIKAILMSMGAVRQSVDQLAARQQQMANAIATLKATEQNILRKINSAPSARPAAAPARKPV